MLGISSPIFFIRLTGKYNPRTKALIAKSSILKELLFQGSIIKTTALHLNDKIGPIFIFRNSLTLSYCRVSDSGA